MRCGLGGVQPPRGPPSSCELDLDVEGSSSLQPPAPTRPQRRVPAWALAVPKSAAGPGRRARRPYLWLFSWRLPAPRAGWKLSPRPILDVPRHFLGPWSLASWWAVLGRGPGSGSHRPSSVPTAAIGHRSVFVGSTARGSVPTLRPGPQAGLRSPVQGPPLPGQAGNGSEEEGAAGGSSHGPWEWGWPVPALRQPGTWQRLSSFPSLDSMEGD